MGLKATWPPRWRSDTAAYSYPAIDRKNRPHMSYKSAFQPTVAGNSLSEWPQTLFWNKNEFIKDVPEQKAWGIHGWNWVWLDKICFLLFTARTPQKTRPQKGKSAQGHNYNISPHWALIHLFRLCQDQDVVHLLNRLSIGVCVSAWVEIITEEQDRLCPGHQWCRSRINKLTVTATLDSTCAWAEGPGQSQQTMNIYLPPCVSPWCVNNARPTSVEWTN